MVIASIEENDVYRCMSLIRHLANIKTSPGTNCYFTTSYVVSVITWSSNECMSFWLVENGLAQSRDGL